MTIARLDQRECTFRVDDPAAGRVLKSVSNCLGPSATLSWL